MPFRNVFLVLVIAAICLNSRVANAESSILVNGLKNGKIYIALDAKTNAYAGTLPLRPNSQIIEENARNTCILQGFDDVDLTSISTEDYEYRDTDQDSIFKLDRFDPRDLDSWPPYYFTDSLYTIEELGSEYRFPGTELLLAAGSLGTLYSLNAFLQLPVAPNMAFSTVALSTALASTHSAYTTARKAISAYRAKEVPYVADHTPASYPHLDWKKPRVGSLKFKSLNCILNSKIAPSSKDLPKDIDSLFKYAKILPKKLKLVKQYEKLLQPEMQVDLATLTARIQDRAAEILLRKLEHPPLLKDIPKLREDIRKAYKIAQEEGLSHVLPPEKVLYGELSNLAQMTARAELSTRVGLKQNPINPPIVHKDSFHSLGTCKGCLDEDTQLYPCLALDKDCSKGHMCRECMQDVSKHLLQDVRMGGDVNDSKTIICTSCNKPINPELIEHIGCKEARVEFDDLQLRLKLLEDPLWKFCPTPNCINGDQVKKGEQSNFTCNVCNFKGCLSCGKDHVNSCEAFLAEEKQLKEALELGIHKKPYPIYDRRTNPFPEHKDLMKAIYAHRDPEKLSKNGTRYAELNEEEYFKDLNEGEYYDIIYANRDMGQYGDMSYDNFRLLGTFRPCPKCGTMTEKGPACWHMTCGCGQDWNYDSGLEHPKSTLFDYGGKRNFRMVNDDPDGVKPEKPLPVVPVEAKFGK